MQRVKSLPTSFTEESTKEVAGAQGAGLKMVAQGDRQNSTKLWKACDYLDLSTSLERDQVSNFNSNEAFDVLKGFIHGDWTEERRNKLISRHSEVPVCDKEASLAFIEDKLAAVRDGLLCPISLAQSYTPVIAQCGHTVDLSWLKSVAGAKCPYRCSIAEEESDAVTFVPKLIQLSGAVRAIDRLRGVLPDLPDMFNKGGLGLALNFCEMGKTEQLINLLERLQSNKQRIDWRKLSFSFYFPIVAALHGHYDTVDALLQAMQELVLSDDTPIHADQLKMSTKLIGAICVSSANSRANTRYKKYISDLKKSDPSFTFMSGFKIYTRGGKIGLEIPGMSQIS